MVLLRDKKSGSFFKQSRTSTKEGCDFKTTHSTLTMTDDWNNARIFSVDEAQKSVLSYCDHGIEFEIVYPRLVIRNVTKGTYLNSLSTNSGNKMTVTFSSDLKKAHTFKNREILESVLTIVQVSFTDDGFEAEIVGV